MGAPTLSTSAPVACSGRFPSHRLSWESRSLIMDGFISGVRMERYSRLRNRLEKSFGAIEPKGRLEAQSRFRTEMFSLVRATDMSMPCRLTMVNSSGVNAQVQG